MDPSPFPSQVQGDRYTDVFAHSFLPPQPSVAADVLDNSLFPNQPWVQGDRYTDAFAHSSQPFVAANVPDPSLFPNQSWVQEDKYTDAFTHSSQPFVAADVPDPSLFPNQSRVQEDKYTDAFTHSSLPPQPSVAADVLDNSLFPNQSWVQGDRYTDAFAHSSQPFVAADVPDPSLFPNQSWVQEDKYTDAFTHSSLPPQPSVAADVLDRSLSPNQSWVQGDRCTDIPSLLSESFVDPRSSQSSVNRGHNFLHPRSNPRDLVRRALSLLQHFRNLTQGDATNMIYRPSLEQAVPPFQAFDQNQGRLTTGVFADSISATSDLTRQATTAATPLDEMKRAVRIRADDKEDQGGRCHTWAELMDLSPPTHDALRWAAVCADIHVVRDIFPSRRTQDVNLVLDAGITLYDSENGESIGELVFGFPYLLTQFCYSELAISRPDSRRTILNAASHSRSNDKDALETQIVLRHMGFLKNQQAKVLEANLSKTLHWFGANFDFIDFTSVRTT
jgi:hypothetical protein